MTKALGYTLYTYSVCVCVLSFSLLSRWSLSLFVLSLSLCFCDISMWLSDLSHCLYVLSRFSRSSLIHVVTKAKQLGLAKAGSKVVVVACHTGVETLEIMTVE